MLHVFCKTQNACGITYVAVVVDKAMIAIIGGLDAIPLGKGGTDFPHPLCHLGMVCRHTLVEHTNVLMCSKRHPMGVEKTSRLGFLPNEVVSPPRWIAHHQFGREQSLPEQDVDAMLLDNPPVLIPQIDKWNDCIPFVPGGSVWKIADDGINRMVLDAQHTIDAFFIVYNICFSHTN